MMSPKELVTGYQKPELWFRAASERRKAYLSEVDKIVLKNAVTPMLDVGSGDGVRAKSIADRARIETLVLIEPFEDMLRLSRQVGATRVVQAKAEDIGGMDLGGPFNTITCLWHVLGDVEGGYIERRRVLENMRVQLSDSGRIILDVNQRYNVRQYGWRNLVRNAVRDALLPAATSNGKFSYAVELNGSIVRQETYFFTPNEIDSMARDIGLTVKEKFYLDYQTGQPRKFPIEGQLVYVLAK